MKFFNLPLVEPIEEAALDNVTAFTQVIMGTDPSLDFLAKQLYATPNTWLAYNKTLYVTKHSKICNKLYDRLKLLAAIDLEFKLDWAYQREPTFLLPPYYYLYAFRMRVDAHDGHTSPTALTNPYNTVQEEST